MYSTEGRPMWKAIAEKCTVLWCEEIFDPVRTNMNYTLQELLDICSQERTALKADKERRRKAKQTVPESVEGHRRRPAERCEPPCP